MVQLRVLVAIPENLGSVSSTQMMTPNHLLTPVPEDSMPASDLQGHQRHGIKMQTKHSYA